MRPDAWSRSPRTTCFAWITGRHCPLSCGTNCAGNITASRGGKLRTDARSIWTALFAAIDFLWAQDEEKLIEREEVVA